MPAMCAQKQSWYKGEAMLRIVDYNAAPTHMRCVLLLGYFDGMHVGHRALVAAAKQIAAEVGCALGITTFYDAKNGGQIYDFNERCELFASLGIDFVFAARYDAALRATQGDAYLEHVCRVLDVHAFVCGEDYTYGCGAACDTKNLQDFASLHSILLRIVPMISFCGEKAAATLAKRYLREGDMPSLKKLLGKRYFISGTVESEGRHVGRRLGFPTANLHVSPCKYPMREGVYAVSAAIDGAVYRGIANYGTRPTFADETFVLEVYFDGYAGDLYGKTLTIDFDFYIRPVRKFANAAQLVEQLRRDLEAIR